MSKNRYFLKVIIALPLVAAMFGGCASTAKSTAGSTAGSTATATAKTETAAPVVSGPGWVVYPCDATPDLSTPAFYVNNAKNLPAVSTIIDDPEIAGNKLLQFVSALGPDNKFCWATNWNIDPAAGGTIVFRVKPAENTPPMAMILDFEIRDGVYRDRLVGYGDGRIQLDKAGVKATFDSKAWHLFRVTMKQQDGGLVFNVYMDENPTPLLTGKSTEPGEKKLFRFGDGSGNDYASSLYDWVIWSDKGVYGPETALPEGLKGL